MCGFSDSVETFLDPRRRSVRERKPGRMQRVERVNVLVIIVVPGGIVCFESSVVELQLRN